MEIGEWQIARPLGNGGMSHTYLAYHASYGWCVLKIRAESAPLERFQQEAETCVRLSHECIVRVVATGEDVWVDCVAQWIAFEYVEGKTLDALVHERSLTAREILFIAEAVCDAMAYAHRCGIVHRDLKPENIILPFDDEGRVAGLKIIDFGIAKDFGRNLTVTRVGPCGTPSYMAPEQWTDPKSAGPTADVWAIALVIYFMMTRRDAFEIVTLSPSEALPVLARGLPCASEVSAQVFGVLRTATIFEADFRYPSVGRFWEAFWSAWARDEAEFAQHHEALSEAVTQLVSRPPPVEDADVPTQVSAVHMGDPLRDVQVPETLLRDVFVDPTAYAEPPVVAALTVMADVHSAVQSPGHVPSPFYPRYAQQAVSSKVRREWILLWVVAVTVIIMIASPIIAFLVLRQNNIDPPPLIRQDAGAVLPRAVPTVADVPRTDVPRVAPVPPARPTPPIVRRPAGPRTPSRSPAPSVRPESCEDERSRLGLPYDGEGHVRLPAAHDWWSRDSAYRDTVCRFMLRCMNGNAGSTNAYIRRCASPPPVRAGPQY